MSLLRRKVSDVKVCNIDPVCINVIPVGINTVDGESTSSTNVEIFTVENQRLNTPLQNQSSSVGEEAFGDISLVLQCTLDEHELVRSRTNDSSGDDNGLAIVPVTEPTSLPIDYVKNEDDDTTEIVQSPQIPVMEDELPVQTPNLEVLANRRTQGTNTDVTYKPSVYIHTQFDLMYGFGTCAYRTIIEDSIEGNDNWLHWAVWRTRMVIKLIFMLVYLNLMFLNFRGIFIGLFCDNSCHVCSSFIL